MGAKIFCIGFHKTGTTSLGLALRMLGYKVRGPLGLNDPNIDKNVHGLVYPLVERYDAFQDNPWPILYEDLDVKFPGSKFILTVRDPESWYESQLRHFGFHRTWMRKWIYGVGCPAGNKEIYIQRYNSHNRDVVEYFKGREGDFLLLDLPNGDGWDKLCNFLCKVVPNVPFPHARKG